MLTSATEPNLPTPDQTRSIRQILDDTGFTEANILRLLGVDKMPGTRLRDSRMSEFVERADDDHFLGTLVKLFVLNTSVPFDDFRDAIGASDIADWTGLIEADGDTVRSTAELCPYEDLIAAADWPSVPEVGRDDVMSVAASSRALLQMTIRREVDATLDLGSGCGIQSIAAAHHSRQTLGSDINPRAVEFAKFNSLLNGRSNSTFVTGGFFDAVDGQKFDLLVCNPPFVVAPRKLKTHTGLGGRSDELTETIVRSAPNYLQEDGFAQFVCNWVQIGDESAEEHVAKWLFESGCDAWVLHSHNEAAEDYARARAEENETGAQGVDRLYNEWVEYFLRENITSVNFGVITLRRKSGHRTWFRFDQMPETSGRCGRSVEREFRLLDFLEEHASDAELLGSRIRISPETEFLENSGKTQIRLSDGLRFSENVSSDIARFLRECDGERPLIEYLLHEAASRKIVVEKAAPMFASVTRQLLSFGFLIPVEFIGL